MQSFRTELENPVIEKDIIELERKIALFKEGKINDEKFRSLRLARGVYGQRQPGVQMIRIKLPYGKLTVNQLLRIAEVSDEYSTGNLHLTTRQDIQIHYVSLDRTPQLWADLEKDSITLREACGNTVRNVTASDNAGIDKDELFDVVPYADALYKYFLRNPICQEMGRKIKIAFSSSNADTALTYMHDLGFIPKVKIIDGKEVRGFKVLVGGGLGAQPILAKTGYEFLAADEIIPYTEAILRVFDRNGERSSRHKARLKFLIAKIGWDEFVRLVEEERPALKSKIYPIELPENDTVVLPDYSKVPNVKPVDEKGFEIWSKTNVVEQKQEGYYAVYINVQLGNFSTQTARKLTEIVKQVAADDIRITISQNLQLRYVTESSLPFIYNELAKLNLAASGYNGVADIIACPGTDTCNLGISNSTATSNVLESVIRDEFPDLISNNEIKIRISGCMNSCGQHGMASIGFHGSSLKGKDGTAPALQVLLGGGTLGNGEGRVADKVLKVPSKRGPEVLRTVLNNYEEQANEGEYFLNYYLRQGEKYFYDLLKPIADVATLTPEEYLDWGKEEKFATAIGVGECAGVVIDLVATLLYESDEKEAWAAESFEQGAWADSIYHSYSVIIGTAKALLLGKGVTCNTHSGIIRDFQKHFVEEGAFAELKDFEAFILQINKNEPSEEFAGKYLTIAQYFLAKAKENN